MKKKNVNKGISKVVSELMDRVMDKVLITDPFIKEKRIQANHFMRRLFQMKYLKVHILKDVL